MSSFYQSVISIISKPSENRLDEDIDLILNWFVNLFRKKSAVFGDISAEVIRDIIKNCSFETKNENEIIIQQGDIGDCFYINLRGKVSVYINYKKYDESDKADENAEEDAKHFFQTNIPEIRFDDKGSTSTGVTGTAAATGQNGNQEATNEREAKKIRDKLGNYVTTLSAGVGFGEVALVSNDMRSASIIADELTDLLVVNKQLYNRCLKASTMRKLNEKQNFINNSPFFGNWAPKMKKLLSLCLERDIFPYDSYLGRQLETSDRIYFIISGQAKVTVNPTLHTIQYPRLYPLRLPENDINDWFIEDGSRGNGQSSPTKKHTSISSMSSNNPNPNCLLKRRNETFAEAEKRLKVKNIEVGILGPGEITGMCEILFEMPSYMQSTKCVEDCDVFFLSKKYYERLISKRNPTCINKMKQNVLLKLATRNSRLNSSNRVDLFRSLQYRLEQSKVGVSLLSNHQLLAGVGSSIDTTANFYHNEFILKSHATEHFFGTTMSSAGAGIGGSEALYKLRLKPRGHFIQLDLRTKSDAYVRFKNALKMTSRRQVAGVGGRRMQEDALSNIDDKMNMTFSEYQDSDLHTARDHRAGHRGEHGKGKANRKGVDSDDLYNDMALADLEDRIKNWHLNFGSSKVYVARLNRVDATKLKFVSNS